MRISDWSSEVCSSDFAAHECVCDLWRDNMDHVEMFCDPGGSVAALLHEGRELAWAVDRHQRGFEVQMRVITFDIFHQRRNIDRDPEQHGAAGVELDVYVFEIAGEIGRAHV